MTVMTAPHSHICVFVVATINWSENHNGGISTHPHSDREPSCGLGVGLCHAATGAIADRWVSACWPYRRPLHAWLCRGSRTGQPVRRGRNHSADVRGRAPFSSEGSPRGSEHRHHRSSLSERDFNIVRCCRRPQLRLVLGGQHPVWPRSVGGEYRHAYESTYR